MVLAGALDGLSEVYAMHNLPIVPLGEGSRRIAASHGCCSASHARKSPVTVYAGMVVVRTGAVMSHTAEFHIVVTGTGGHGGLPAVGTDALTAAAHVVVALQVRRARYGCHHGAHNVC